MRLHILGPRQDRPAYFDMACRCKPHKARWYGGGFRMGDRAAAYVYLSEWRHHNPNRKLIVLDNVGLPGTFPEMSADWLFAGIADEAYVACGPSSPIPVPRGERLYTQSLWLTWRQLRMRHDKLPKPAIRPDREALQTTSRWSETINLPPFYVTLQPLYDAKYEGFRNQSIEWWQEVCTSLNRRGIPVLVLDCFTSAFPIPEGCYPQLKWPAKTTIMYSMALVSNACVHVGGQTGLTLWSAIFGVPTVAAYKHWGIMDHRDARPIPFGAPVEPADLRGPPDAVAQKVEKLFYTKAVRA